MRFLAQLVSRLCGKTKTVTLTSIVTKIIPSQILLISFTSLIDAYIFVIKQIFLPKIENDPNQYGLFHCMNIGKSENGYLSSNKSGTSALNDRNLAHCDRIQCIIARFVSGRILHDLYQGKRKNHTDVKVMTFGDACAATSVLRKSTPFLWCCVHTQKNIVRLRCTLAAAQASPNVITNTVRMPRLWIL